ncbi:MAG TPA: hypothetical protein VGR35_10045 [Tepidisphaeraceae bacterium]|nr:hypothetical protein [Tepidisphaeraceae bacterium]
MEDDHGEFDGPPPPALPLGYQSPWDRLEATTAQRVSALLLAWAAVMVGAFVIVAVADTPMVAIALAFIVVGGVVAWGLTAQRSPRRHGLVSSIFVGLGLGLLCQGLCFYTLSGW